MTVQPPFKYDVVGSFLRPDYLKKAREEFANKTIDAKQLKAIEDKAIQELVAKEKEVGLQAVTDGEFRRRYWHLDFLADLDGVEEIKADHWSVHFKGHQPKAATLKITDKIDFGNHPFVLYHDIAIAYQKVIRAFYDAGCRYLQLDDTSWGEFCDANKRKAYKERGLDLDKIAKSYVDMINLALEAKPEDMTITMHICRGNFRSTWFSSGGYEPVAEILFDHCKVDGFFLEYDSERSGDFSPLRFIKDQKVVLGLITSKFAKLEDKEEVKKRIQEAEKYVAKEQLCLSPQCGFSSTEEGNIMTEDEQWAKVKLVKEIAEEVWR